jgi:type II secretory pathway component PulK
VHVICDAPKGDKGVRVIFVLFPVVLVVEVLIADLASRRALGYKTAPQ